VRLALVTATPQTVHTGSGTFVALATLTQGLRALGHRVETIAPSRNAPPFGYTVHRFGFNRALSPRHIGSADVVVGWDMDGYRLAGRCPVPFVSYVHGQLADEARFERGLVALSMRLQARAERRSVLRAGAVLTVSEHARRRLAASYGIPGERIAVVPPAFDGDRWRAALAAAPGSSAGGRPTVLCVARLYPRKDVATLLRGAAILRRDVPDLLVRVVGDGPERRRLVALARALTLEGTVEFSGQVPFRKLAAAYASCDVFCLPSRQEGFGIVFLEAMAAARPIVTCRGTAAEELVPHGRDGLLVPQQDPAALAAALRVLLADPELRRKLGAGGPARVRSFAPEPIARRFLDALPKPAGGPS